MFSPNETAQINAIKAKVNFLEAKILLDIPLPN
jgi:hypothetical protein